nr:transposase [Methylobacter tundripaludum]
MDAIVILPDHLHAVWTLPDGDADYSGRWRAIKSKFTHELQLSGMPLTPDKRGEYRLWQRRFWEHTIRDDTDFQRHVDYIHWDPVKHGLTQCVADWPYSSFHHYVRLGSLSPEWAATINDPIQNSLMR